VGVTRELKEAKVQGASKVAEAAIFPKERTKEQENAFALADPEPWPDEVDGADLFAELERIFGKFLVLPVGAPTVLAAWTMHAHALDAFEVTPYLAITSPEKGCGKTVLLDVLSGLVPRPLPSSNVTPSVVFRAVEKYRPTLLIDEADTFLRHNDELKGILNSGHRKSTAFVIRSVGEDFDPTPFRTWSAKAIALIGRLPATLADRSIEVRMNRKRADERVERFRHHEAEQEMASLRSRAWRWGQEHADELRAMKPRLPDGLGNRVEDNWTPLFAVAELAGAKCTDRLAEACRGVVREIEDESIRALLLSDIRGLFFSDGADRLSSEQVAEKLVSLEERPWAEFGKNERPLSKNRLASLLQPFGVRPRTVRLSNGDRKKGYLREHFEDAWGRYLPPPPPLNRDTVTMADLEDKRGFFDRDEKGECHVPETDVRGGLMQDVTMSRSDEGEQLQW
jgi:putative DNA primase/helicase